MKAYLYWFVLAFSALTFFSCSKENVDNEKPVIDVSIANAFPQNCDTLYFGEAFILKVLLKDNVALGSFSIDVHNNFDHHSHSTEVTACTFDSIKTPVNPFVFIEQFSLPEEQGTYETSFSVMVPSTNGNGVYDEGDYHFFMSLTDHEGWSVQKGLSIKMLYH